MVSPRLCVTALCLLALALTHTSEATGRNPIRRLFKLVRKLERFINDGLNRIENLEEVVTKLARQECQTGSASVVNCASGFQNITGTIICIQGPIAGGQGVNENFTISFSPAFMAPPVVDISISGQAILGGKNLSTEVHTVTASDFTFKYIADDYLPISTDLTWYACPSALFDETESLPLEDEEDDEEEDTLIDDEIIDLENAVV